MNFRHTTRSLTKFKFIHQSHTHTRDYTMITKHILHEHISGSVSESNWN